MNEKLSEHLHSLNVGPFQTWQLEIMDDQTLAPPVDSFLLWVVFQHALWCQSVTFD